MTDEEWDKSVADSDNIHSLIKWGRGHYKVLKGVKNFKKCIMTPPQLSTQEYLYDLRKGQIETNMDS